MGQPLYCSAAVAGVRGGRGYGDGSTHYVWPAVSPCFHGCLAFLYRYFPSESLPLHPLNTSLHSQLQPCSGFAPQSLNSSCCAYQGTCILVQGMLGCSKDCLILIPFRLPQISCFTLVLNVSPLNQTVVPMWGLDPCFSSPSPPKAGPVLLTLLFFTVASLSYHVLCGSVYSFPLVRYSCQLSAGVLHALLCLKVHSWCICGERCTPSTYSSAILFSLSWF